MKRRPGLLSRLQRPVFMAAAVLLLLLLLQWDPFGPRSDVRSSQPNFTEVTQRTASTPSSSATSGMMFLRPKNMSSKVEALLEVPSKCIGILFVAHGCGHAATDFWSKSAACPQCLGLPEEVNITRRALARGYAVLAVSSSDRSGTRCWKLAPPSQPSVDMLQVRDLLQYLDSDESPQLRGKPQYAMGASSGGGFVLALAGLHPVAGVASQIMAVPNALLQAPRVPPGRNFPPTMFIHMPRDQFTADRVKQNLLALQAQGVSTAERQFRPVPVTPDWLQHKLGLSAEAARQLHSSFREAGIVDSSNMLVDSPRESKWRAAISPALLKGDLQSTSLQADESPLAEVLNLAYAGHEIISDTTDNMLDWFESQIP